jgi:hypothetical protein
MGREHSPGDHANPVGSMGLEPRAGKRLHLLRGGVTRIPHVQGPMVRPVVNDYETLMG